MCKIIWCNYLSYWEITWRLALVIELEVFFFFDKIELEVGKSRFNVKFNICRLHASFFKGNKDLNIGINKSNESIDWTSDAFFAPTSSHKLIEEKKIFMTLLCWLVSSSNLLVGPRYLQIYCRVMLKIPPNFIILFINLHDHVLFVDNLHDHVLYRFYLLII